MGVRQYKRLNAKKIAALSGPGRYADGDGLHLVVDANGTSVGLRASRPKDGGETWGSEGADRITKTLYDDAGQPTKTITVLGATLEYDAAETV